MKSYSHTISKVFSGGGDIHYVLPHFQREYRWEEKNWSTLLEDAQGVHDRMPEVSGRETRGSLEHFMGALVVLPDGTEKGTIAVHRLVDGQQRLTSVSLLLCALGHVAARSHPSVVKKIRKLILNPDEEGSLRFKILPTTKNGDREAYARVVGATMGAAPQVAGSTSRIPQAFEYFRRALEKRVSAGEVNAEVFFEVVTSKFQTVWIELASDENPYQIFESLNNKGEPLGQSDLVRNYVAMRLPSAQQEAVFLSEWAPIEARLSDARWVGRLGELTAFLRHYDAMHSGVLGAEKAVYERFRDRMKPLSVSKGEFAQELAQLRRFALHYDHLLRAKDMTHKADDKTPEAALARLAKLDISTAYPFLLQMLDRHESGAISGEDFVAGCQRLENYLLRRFLVAEQTAYHNKMFAALGASIDWAQFVPSLSKALIERNYPSDRRIREVLPTRPLYDKNAARERTVLLLERVNLHLSAGSGGSTILNSKPTIEHILPQTPGAQWQEALGENWREAVREWTHTLGNLTLVTGDWNSSLSNAPFSHKKPRLAGHALLLNSKYFSRDIPTWDAHAIEERGKWLTEQVLEIWPSFVPELGEVVASYATPTAIVIRGHKTEVSSWRGALRAVGKLAVESGADFDALSRSFPSLISANKFPHGEHLLANGWHLNTNWSGAEIKKHCAKLLAALAVAPDEWRIEEAS